MIVATLQVKQSFLQMKRDIGLANYEIILLMARPVCAEVWISVSTTAAPPELLTLLLTSQCLSFAAVLYFSNLYISY